MTEILLKISTQGQIDSILDLTSLQEVMSLNESQKKVYTLGFSNECSVFLNYPTISKNHAEIHINGSNVMIKDNGSRNGTILKRIHRTEKRTLSSNDINLDSKLLEDVHSGDSFVIGPFEIELVVPSISKDERRKIFCNHLEKKIIELEQGLTKTDAIKLLTTYGKTLLHKYPLSNEETQNIILSFYSELFEDGPLGTYIKNPDCKEILSNGYNDIFIDTGSGLKKLEHGFYSEKLYLSWIQRKVSEAKRRLDLQSPICEGTLQDGARLQAVLPPVCKGSGILSIRRFGGAPFTEEEALASGWLTKEALEILKKALIEKKNLIVSGGTSAGKTSLLNFLCQFIPKQERVVTVEDTLELQIPLDNVVSLQARKSNSEGIGEVSLRHLVQCALRLRPDRIVVGECRGSEVLEMLQAMNTGHPGSLTTLHANSGVEALSRLELLLLMGATNLSNEAVKEWIFHSIDMVVQVHRTIDGIRQVKTIAKIDKANPGQLHELYSI